MLALGGTALIAPSVASTDEPQPASAAPGAAQRDEVVSLRTENSRTYRLGDGTFEQEVAPVALNFRDASGAWRAIDNTLERRPDGDLENAANSFGVRIPDDAGDPVTVSSGGRSLSFALQGANARATARVDGAQARYPAARRATTLEYDVAGRTLKESLTLSSPDAPSVHRFDVDWAGMAPVVTRLGTVAFRDAQGRQRFAFAAPWVRDDRGIIAKAAHYEIEASAGRDVVKLVVDPAWLRDPARSFPVVVDPTVYEGAEGMCELISGDYANSSWCDVSMPLTVGRWSGRVRRAALQLELPRDVAETGRVITGAELEFTLDDQWNWGTSEIALHGLTREVGPGATWNSAMPGIPWTTPGGDLTAERESVRVLDSSAIGDRVALGLPRLVQAWTDDTAPDNGVIIKAVDESVERVNVLEDFVLKVRYHHRTGLDPVDYTYDRWDLADGSSVHVNIADQNLIVSANDFGLDGFDDELSLDRTYNAQDDVVAQGVFGLRWRGDFGTVRLWHNAVDDSYALHGPTGLDGLFFRHADGTYDFVGDAMNATLVRDAGGGVTVTDLDTDEEWTFDDGDPHRLVRRGYFSGDGTTATYDASGRLETLRDAAGNVVTFGYDASGRMRTATDQDSAVRQYDYDAAGNLTRFTNPAGQTTTYTIDASGRLASVTAHDNSGIAFTYYGTSRYLATVTPFGTDGSRGPTTTYEGDDRFVAVETTGAKDEIHHFDRTFFNTSSVVGDAPPALTLSGALFAARGTVLPEGHSALAYNATSTVGIADVTITLDGEVLETQAQDCNLGCGDVSGTWALDTEELPPGVHAVKVTATTTAGDQRSQAFKVTVPESSWQSDGVLPGDADPAVDEGIPMTTAPCEALFGTGSSLCSTDVHSDPEADEGGASALLAASPHHVAYGLAQDFREADWLNAPLLKNFRSRFYRRIVPINIAETTDGTRFNGDRSRLRYRELFEHFEATYKAIYEPPEDSGRDPGKLLVSFGKTHCEDRLYRDDCRSPGPLLDLPLQGRYKTLLRSFFTAFPNVDVISAWNEPNNPDQPLHRPRRDETALRALRGGAPRAAKYTFWAMQVCHEWVQDLRRRGEPNPSCTVAAAELNQRGYGKSASWPEYLKTYRNQLESEFVTHNPPFARPRYWAWHPYVDLRVRRVPTGTRRYAEALPSGSRIWLTEVGSRVDRNPDDNAKPPLTERRNTEPQQRAEVVWLYDRLAQSRRNITRLYYYSPFSGRITIQHQVDRVWDSALVGDDMEWLGDYVQDPDHGRQRRYDYGGLDDGVRESYCVVLAHMNPGLAESETPQKCR